MNATSLSLDPFPRYGAIQVGIPKWLWAGNLAGASVYSVTAEGSGKVRTVPYGDPAQTPPFSRDFAPGRQVTLTAEPAIGWAFTGWSGDAWGTSLSTGITMPTNPNASLTRSVKATFEQILLTVDKVGEGTVTPPGGGAVTLPHTLSYGGPQTVNLSANPAPGWGFKHWTGDASGTNQSTSVLEKWRLTAPPGTIVSAPPLP